MAILVSHSFLSILLLYSPYSLAADHSDTSEPYILALNIGDIIADEGLLAFIDNGQLYIHFEMFITAVQFPIALNENEIWSGWYFDEQQRFEMNQRAGLLSINEKQSLLSNNDFLQGDDGLFVAADTLESWFSITLQADYRQQTLSASADRLFPQQQAAKRYSNQMRYRGINESSTAFVQDQYQWFTGPQVDFRAEIRHIDIDEQRHDSENISLTTSLDILKQHTFYSGSFSHRDGDESVSVQRLTFQRRAATEQGQLFLAAGSYQFGDVFLADSNLATRGGNGTGFILERHHNLQNTSSGQVSITGDAPPGWEAEIYRNEELIQFGRVALNGQYLFDDLATQAGRNDFVVRLYGPQGQLQQQSHVVWGGGLELTKGDFSYRLAHVDFSQRLLDGTVEGADILPADRSDSMEFSYGIHQDLQLGISYFDTVTAVRDEFGEFSSEKYISSNFRANILNGILLGEWTDQQSRGEAWEVRYLGNTENLSYSYLHQQYDDFESAETVRDIAVEQRDELSLFGQLELDNIYSYSFRLTDERRLDGSRVKVAFNRLGASWNNIYLGNEITYTQRSIGDNSYLGNLKLSGRLNQFSLRAQLSYVPKDSKFFSLASGTLRWQINPNLYTSVQYTQSFKDERDKFLHYQLSWRVNNIDINLNSDITSNDYWSLGLGISTSFGYDNYGKRFYPSRKSLTSSGRATINFYIDDNDNNHYDEGETLVNCVAYKGRLEMSRGENDAIILHDIPGYVPYQFKTEMVRLEDPYLIPKHRVHEIYTHPGSAVEVFIPVQLTGDAEGYIVRSGGKGVSGISVQLIDATGRIIKTVQSEFDGYYSFNQIPVGRYTVHIDLSEITGQFYQQELVLILNKDDGFLALDTVVLSQ